jgi:hypothetical protein
MKRPLAQYVRREPAERTFLLSVILVITADALYYPVGNHSFLDYDDWVYVMGEYPRQVWFGLGSGDGGPCG